MVPLFIVQWLKIETLMISLRVKHKYGKSLVFISTSLIYQFEKVFFKPEGKKWDLYLWQQKFNYIAVGIILPISCFYLYCSSWIELLCSKHCKITKKGFTLKRVTIKPLWSRFVQLFIIWSLIKAVSRILC